MTPPRRWKWILGALGLFLLGLLSLGRVEWVRHHPRAERGPASNDSGVAELAPPALPPSVSSAPGSSAGAPVPASSTPNFLPHALFAYVAPPVGAAAFEAHVAAPTQRIYYVKPSLPLIEGKKSPFWSAPGVGRFDVNLPDGRRLPVVVEKSRMVAAQAFVSTGSIEGAPDSRVVFSYNQGEVSAVFEDTLQGVWQMRAAIDGTAQFFQVDPAKVPPCGGDRRLTSAVKTALASVAHRAVAASSGGSAKVEAEPGTSTDVSGATMAAATGSSTEVRVLVVYTDAVATAHPNTAGIVANINLAVATMNDDLAHSQIPVTITLAGTSQITYSADFVTGPAQANFEDDALTRLADPTDGYMDSVHALRDQLSADLVCLLHNGEDTASAGLAYVPDAQGDIGNQAFGFSVVDYAYVISAHVFSHELGHNFGCAHDRDHSVDDAGQPSSGVFPYSFGYRFNGADGRKYCTIMAYTDNGYTRLGYFSNPNLKAPAPINVALGVPHGQAGEADNASTISQMGYEIGHYRLDAQTPVSPGTLINVSTLAFVGATAQQQLINGFVVSGTQPKTVLVRVAGPALGSLGVSGVLADPEMTLFQLSGGGFTKLSFNDNWGESSSLAALTTAMQQSAPAFPFPSGSKDAAIVATLGPGSYSANIDGVGGGTGVAIVEAYEVDRNNNKLVNLSTRGYVDSAHPMTAGFVIQADPANPGKNKRILVRVLGPSLANFGITGALNDPTVSLYDSKGALLLFDDDWSSGSQIVNGANDDAKPTVTLYSEQKIFATGFAPGNRRDSAVLVDLPPGSYTAIVKPFEQLPDQPAQPGVALVEVYEINTP